MKVQKTCQARTRNFEKIQKSDIERVVLRSNLHKKIFILIDFDKRDQWHEIVEIVKVIKFDKSISSTRSIFLIILYRFLLTIDSFFSSTINTIIEQISFVLYWLSLVTKTSRNVVIYLCDYSRLIIDFKSKLFHCLIIRTTLTIVIKLERNAFWYTKTLHFQKRKYVFNFNRFRFRIIQLVHDNVASEHLERFKCYNLIIRVYWWLNMYKYIQRFVRNCHVCFRFKSSRQKI